MNERESKVIISEVNSRPTALQELTKNGFNWSSDISAIAYLLEEVLRKYSDQPKLEAFVTTLKIADVVGGCQMYLPRAEGVKKALRSVLIRQEFNGENKDFLLKKYGISNRTFQEEIKFKRNSKQILIPKPKTEVGQIPSKKRTPQWSKGIIAVLDSVSDSLNSVGINDEDLTLKVAINLMSSIGGKQVYFPRGAEIHRYFNHCEIYRARLEGTRVRDIAKMHGITAKRVYEICQEMEAKELESQ